MILMKTIELTLKDLGNFKLFNSISDVDFEHEIILSLTISKDFEKFTKGITNYLDTGFIDIDRNNLSYISDMYYRSNGYYDDRVYYEPLTLFNTSIFIGTKINHVFSFGIKTINKNTGIVSEYEFVYEVHFSTNVLYRERVMKLYQVFVNRLHQKYEYNLSDAYIFVYNFVGFENSITEMMSKKKLKPLAMMTDIINELKEGQHPSELRDKYNHRNEIIIQRNYNSIDLDLPIMPKLKISFEKFSHNNRRKTFDYITIELSIISSGFDNDIRKFRETFKKEKKQYDAYIVKELKANTKFKNFGIPINFLKVDKILITNDWLCIYTLSLKIDSPEVEEITYTDPTTGRPV